VLKARTGGAAAAAVIALLTLTACTTTVVGHGVALNAGASSTASPPPGFPSTSEAPSSPGSTSSPTSSDSGHGVLVTYPAGHFSAVMPTQATERSENGNLGGQSFTVYLAISVSDGSVPTEVASEDIDHALDPSEYAATLRVAVGSFAGSSGMSVDSQTATTFRGYTARRALVTSPDGQSFSLLVFVYSPTRIYVVFASEGAVYNQVTSTLRLLP